eukprot:CAMPEP_0119315002 /NCGR_PEP_ID=MMETSP1333-20130426/34149_1 /TAXON_ID=418940 /ORGANISM="Scyphosphaera apsteinii, Strain RCC1455" /LENGTH=47 /DNA_ID= /DNA_START= /DNA_END= /DNA_ORIENTATION=
MALATRGGGAAPPSPKRFCHGFSVAHGTSSHLPTRGGTEILLGQNAA